jgi:hypothetical protein
VADASVDQLIEEGLNRYGRGDLDGALAVWEQVLALDPRNEQASSYVEYVRDNYDMLTGDAAADESDSPYAIADDEYTVEIFEDKAGDTLSSSPPYIDPIDEGWAIQEWDELAAVSAKAAAAAAGPPVVADREQTVQDGSPVDFESATPTSFANQSTKLRTRDLGFVKPSGTDPPPTSIRPPATVEPAGDGKPGSSAEGAAPVDPTARMPTITQPEPRSRRSSSPPELKMSLRTPAAHAGEPMPDPAERPPTVEETTGFTRFGPAPTPAPRPIIDIELPMPSPPVRDVRATAPTEPPPSLEAELRATGELTRAAQVAIGAAQTAEIPAELRAPGPVRAPRPSEGLDLDDRRTRDLDRATGERMLAVVAATSVDPKAATRDLAIRPHPASASGELKLPPPDGTEQTRTDLAPPFGALDARAAQILDEIDHGASVDEPRDDRTRRRITSLLDRATDWHRLGDIAKAVTAVDLALSEEPGSPLAQKLVHRNRDTIMTVFQAYLGDLQRAPALAQPLHELAAARINPRAAFLLSRIDGTLSVDEILDVSGMPRLEAYRHLCQLLLRGIIK